MSSASVKTNRENHYHDINSANYQCNETKSNPEYSQR